MLFLFHFIYTIHARYTQLVGFGRVQNPMDAGKTKILLVEDDSTIREALALTFTKEGFIVSEAVDGEDGLKKAFGEHPVLIMLDLIMPKMDGMTMLKKLREDDWGKDVPVIILTNVNSDANLQQIVEHRPAYYLVKSDTPLVTVVEKAREVIERPAQSS